MELVGAGHPDVLSTDGVVGRGGEGQWTTGSGSKRA